MAVPESGRVTVERDVVFGTGGGRELQCNVYTPPPGTSNGAGVLLVHGGGWRSGDRSQLHGYGILLGRIGYLCVASEYRLSGEAKWPAQIHDVKAAVRWMRAHASELKVDPEKICISGNSAGAHLSLMAAGTAGHAAFEGEGGSPGVRSDVAACIAFYGPALIGARVAAAAGAEPVLPEVVALLMGKDATDQQLRDASPVTWAKKEFPPTLLMHGNRDELVPVASAFRMHEVLSKAGAPVELHVYNKAPHAFDAVPELGRQCASIMALFLDRHVVAPREVMVPAAEARAAAGG
ncbi:MAG: alpha/beta hydrolase [Dehalococcoidia bacterium]